MWTDQQEAEYGPQFEYDELPVRDVVISWIGGALFGSALFGLAYGIADILARIFA